MTKRARRMPSASRYTPYFGDRALWLKVREQRETQVAVLGERHVAPDAVDGDAEELGRTLANSGRISL